MPAEPTDKGAAAFLEAGKAAVGHAEPQKPQLGCWKGSHWGKWPGHKYNTLGSLLHWERIGEAERVQDHGVEASSSNPAVDREWTEQNEVYLWNRGA